MSFLTYFIGVLFISVSKNEFWGMNNIVFLRQVIQDIKKLAPDGGAIPNDITCRTFNANNKQGGVLKVYPGIKLLVSEPLQGKKFNPEAHLYRPFRERKNPNHWKNVTLNFETETGRIVKIKLRYIIKFNGQWVAY